MTESGLRLRALRKEVGYTQQDLADELGVGQATISRIERGLYPVPPAVWEHLTRIHSLRDRDVRAQDSPFTSASERVRFLAERSLLILAFGLGDSEKPNRIAAAIWRMLRDPDVQGSLPVESRRRVRKAIENLRAALTDADQIRPADPARQSGPAHTPDSSCPYE